MSHLLQFSDLAPVIGADSNASKAKRGDAAAQPSDRVLPVEEFRTDRWKAIDADVNQYAITWGAAQFRAAIAEKVAWTYPGWEVDPERQICVTCGSSVIGNPNHDGSLPGVGSGNTRRSASGASRAIRCL